MKTRERVNKVLNLCGRHLLVAPREGGHHSGGMGPEQSGGGLRSEREMERGGREEGGIWPKFKFKAGRKPDGTGNMAFYQARCF